MQIAQPEPSRVFTDIPVMPLILKPDFLSNSKSHAPILEIGYDCLSEIFAALGVADISYLKQCALVCKKFKECLTREYIYYRLTALLCEAVLGGNQASFDKARRGTMLKSWRSLFHSLWDFSLSLKKCHSEPRIGDLINSPCGIISQLCVSKAGKHGQARRCYTYQNLVNGAINQKVIRSLANGVPILPKKFSYAQVIECHPENQVELFHLHNSKIEKIVCPQVQVEKIQEHQTKNVSTFIRLLNFPASANAQSCAFYGFAENPLVCTEEEMERFLSYFGNF